MDQTAQAAANAANSGVSSTGFFLAIVVFLAVIMLLSSRSHKKQEEARRKQLNALEKGDKVVLTGGIIGTIVGFNQEILEVKISENTKISVVPSGIVSVIKGNTLTQGENK